MLNQETPRILDSPATVSLGVRVRREVRGALTSPEKWLYARGVLPVNRLTLPDFLGIGAQKAGTTWLYRNLLRHPDLYLPPTKEAHYFDRKFHRPLSFYAARFADARGRLKGEITPAYSLLPLERIRFIRRVMPEVRLIYLLRNPMERAWSQAQMEVIRPALEEGRPVEHDAIVRNLLSSRNRARGAYLANLDRWLSVFPEEQLHVGFFDELAARPREFLEGILRHLGVTTEVAWETYPLHEVIKAGAGVPLTEPYRALLADLYTPDLKALQSRFGDRIANWTVKGCESKP
jgi:hypothetical protein